MSSNNAFNFSDVLRRIADKRIDDAIAEGKFDNLPGKGQPIAIEPAPADENARALWWAIKLMRDNGFVPDEVRLRKAIDQLKSDLARANTAPSIRALAESINGLVRKLNTMGTTALHAPVAPIDIPAELRARGFEP